MKQIIQNVVTLSIITVICSCNHSTTPANSEVSPAEEQQASSPAEKPVVDPDILEITGTIAHVGLEGGFYAIHADDGAKYDPLNLPDAFKKPGLKIKAKARLEKDVMSFHMYGEIINIEEISER
ncbi:MAG: hypothetical protein JXR40_02890 [Pontiellaceae bacterium]|nr:hypothetical protein [Pontiellaceae bacterium]